MKYSVLGDFFRSTNYRKHLLIDMVFIIIDKKYRIIPDVDCLSKITIVAIPDFFVF